MTLALTEKAPETKSGIGQLPNPSPRIPLNPDRVALLTGTANPDLAGHIGDILDIEVDHCVTRFADGEARVRIKQRLDGKKVFIIQPTCPPNVDGCYQELWLMLDAAGRASIGEKTVVIPYMGYTRQDWKEEPRVPISASTMSRIAGYLGADRLVTMELHAPQIMGFFNGPVDSLEANFVLAPRIATLDLPNPVAVSPDEGGFDRVLRYRDILGWDRTGIIFKGRDYDRNNVSEPLDFHGDVAGREAVIFDDLIDTAGTMTNAAQLLIRRGATKVYAAAGHGLFSEPAVARIKGSPIERIFVTDTVPIRENVLATGRVEVVSAAPLLAEAIYRLHNDLGLTDLFLKEGSLSARR